MVTFSGHAGDERSPVGTSHGSGAKCDVSSSLKYGKFAELMVVVDWFLVTWHVQEILRHLQNECDAPRPVVKNSRQLTDFIPRVWKSFNPIMDTSMGSAGPYVGPMMKSYNAVCGWVLWELWQDPIIILLWESGSI